MSSLSAAAALLNSFKYEFNASQLTASYASNVFQEVDDNHIEVDSNSLYALLYFVIKSFKPQLLLLCQSSKPEFMNEQDDTGLFLHIRKMDYERAHPTFESRSLYFNLNETGFPDWIDSFNETLHIVSNDWVHGMNMLKFIQFIMYLIKYLRKHNLNKLKDAHLKLLIAIHELFDSFKKGLIDYLSTIPNYENRSFICSERHLKKFMKIPRGFQLNTLIEEYLLGGSLSDYAHVVLDTQEIELQTNPIEAIDSMMLNLINDCNFFYRFMPGCNVPDMIESFKDMYEFNPSNVMRTKQSIIMNP